MKNDINFKAEESSLKEEVLKYIRHWPLFLIMLVISIGSVLFYLRYSTPSYKTQAIILIKDSNNSSISELAAFEDLGISGATLNRSSFENEMEIIKSKKLLKNIILRLDLDVAYFKDGKIKRSELYEKKPFTLKRLSSDLENKRRTGIFYVKLLSPTEFELKEGENGIYKKHKFGERISSIVGDIVLTPDIPGINDFKKDGSGDAIIVVLNSVENATNALQSALQVNPVSKNSSVINLSLIANNTNKSEDILNTLVDVFNEDAIEDRSIISRSTAEFIDNRLEIITKELDSVETSNVSFKEKNTLTDIVSESQIFLENSGSIRNRKLEVETKISLYNTMEQYLKSGNESELLPANLGVESEAVSKAIYDYNILILEKKRMLQSATNDNPVVISLTEQINDLRANILENLKTVKTTLSIERNNLNSQIGTIGNKLSKIPNISKEYRNIERQQSIKESLYLYLLQKREETAIALAVTSPKAKIVDYANSIKSPVSPNRRMFLIGALAIGLFIPFLIIYSKNLFDTKIHNRVDLEKEIPTLPVLGEIPIIDSKESEVIKNNDRSVLAEAFRILRTNLGYFIKAKQNGNVVFVTSTIKGEGKTFVAYNLAITLTSTNKSVLLIGADIRNPQIHRYIDKNEWTIGLSEYLFDPSVEIESITNKVDIENQSFDVILSGRIPPNPAELLMSDRFEKIINEVKTKYDYVIVDTAPTLLVTDTLLISQFADTTVYVCRAEYTDKKLLQYPKELYDEGKIKNIAFAINGIKITNFGYGSKYGYGYGYGQETPSVFSRIKKLLRFKR
ncbi:tyrosine-protein kinase [uncultured Dokdonia sp.]|uniref:GumC family protein n=1 Tax=uncultured Dokdonia sp. TaxID=575653 RepID=UPI0026390008|nr:tyrosine-protein kinase [uncultured Dokdonia sp.]